MGAALDLFWLNKGALKVQKEGLGGGGGSSLIKVRNFHSPYFGIIFEGES